MFPSIPKLSHHQCHFQLCNFTQDPFTWCKVLMKYMDSSFRNRTLIKTFSKDAYFSWKPFLITERTFRFYCSAHIIIATPGRLEDMFKRKQEGCDLAASVKSLVSLWLLKLIKWLYSLIGHKYAMSVCCKMTYSTQEVLVLDEADRLLDMGFETRFVDFNTHSLILSLSLDLDLENE